MSLRSTLLPPDDALPLHPATDRATWDPATGTVDRSTVDAVRERAAADLGAAWPQPLASAAARVHRDGDRDGWEQLVFARGAD